MSKIREQQFVDDAEMAEILADRKLLARIKQGSRDARLRKGNFVE
jgi:hypothetical protein